MTALRGVVVSREFGHKRDDGLTQGGIFDADEGAMQAQSLIGQRQTGRVSNRWPLMVLKTKEIYWLYTQNLG